MKRQLLMLTAILIAVTAAPTRANIIGNDTSNFNPVPSGVDFISVHGAETLAYGLLNTGLFFNYAENVLPPTFDQTGKRIDPVDAVTFMDFSAAYGLTRHWELGVSFSTLLAQQVERSVPGAQFAATGLNEIRAASKYQFVEHEPIGVAGVLSANFNQSQNNPFAGRDAGATINLEGVIDYHVGPTLVAFNAGYRKRSSSGPVSGALYQPLQDQVIASVAANHYFPALDLKLIGEFFMAQATQKTAQLSQIEDFSSEVLIGAKYDANDNIALHLGAGRRVTNGLFNPDLRVYAGLNVALDVVHATPPPVPTPVPVAVAASAPAPVTVVQQYRGYLPEDIERLRKVDFDDMAKRHEFQLKATVPEADVAGEKPPFEIIRLEGFDFDFGSAVIRPEYHAMLEKLARYLKSKPQVIKVRIEGHTDSIGSLERNRMRSGQRANAVMEFLKKAGGLENIEVETEGYGADRPIADNSNFQGRRQNRRVEVRILRTLESAPVRVK